MKRLTEMTSAELAVVQKRMSSDIQRAVDNEIQNLVTSLECPLNFGKYEGKTLSEVMYLDPQYLLWIADNCPDKLSLLPGDSKALNIKVTEMRIGAMTIRKDEIVVELGKLNKQLKELNK